MSAGNAEHANLRNPASIPLLTIFDDVGPGAGERAPRPAAGRLAADEASAEAIGPTQSRQNVVDSVDFARWADDSSNVPAGHSACGRGTLGLCPPLTQKVDPVDLSVNDDARSTTASVDSAPPALPESLRLLELVGTDEDPYKNGGPWAYADDIGGRCFFITQQAVHVETGTVLLTEDQIKKALSRKGSTKHAWIKHDADVYTADEAREIPKAVAGEPKDDGFHVVELVKSYASVGQIARAFGVPPECVEVKSESAFFDVVEYLTHEHPNQQAKGKHLYADDAVHANFDWRAELEEHKLARSFKAGQRANARKRDEVRLAVMHGELSLKQVREQEPLLHAGDLRKLTELRQDYMLHRPPPSHRTNYYIGGVAGMERKGRTGKTQIARMFARSIYRDLDRDECYHEAKDKRVPLQTYRGQPVIIWDDYSPVDLMEALGGRAGVWQVFDDHPGAGDVNIKYGSTRLVHEVNIITKVTPYAQFLDGLAGVYTDRTGVTHLAEDTNQSWGRFPVVFEVTTDSITLLVNQGFVDDTEEFRAFKKVATMRANMKQICTKLESIRDPAERESATYEIGNVLLRPVLEQHAALQPVATRAGDDVTAELLADIEVLDGPALAAAEQKQVSDRQAKAAAEARREKQKQLAEKTRDARIEQLQRELAAAKDPKRVKRLLEDDIVDMDEELRELLEQQEHLANELAAEAEEHNWGIA